MRMRDVSRFFDRTPVSDPDTGDLLFRAQFRNYDESRRDAFVAYRRVMSVAPDTAIPASRVVRAMGHAWLVGDGQPDGWDEVHRIKYVVHRASGEALVYSLLGELRGDGPLVSTYGDVQWVSEETEEGVSSRQFGQYAAILPDGVTLPEYAVVKIGDSAMLVQTWARYASGFVEARGMLQTSIGPSEIIVRRRAYNPATGGYTAARPERFPARQVRWQELYLYADQRDARYQEGDATFVTLPSANLTTSDSFEHGGRKWGVLATKDVAGALLLHARRA